MTKDFMPIIRIIGLPGAGKTTLAKKLEKTWEIPIYQIGKYRSKFPASVIGEADAWVNLYYDLSKRKWRNCILESTGLNCRESFLKACFSFSRIVTIKLEAQRKVLYERIGKKKKNKQGGEWFFSPHYRDKYEFVRKLFKDYNKVPADIRIDTSKRKPHEVYKVVQKRLDRGILRLMMSD